MSAITAYKALKGPEWLATDGSVALRKGEIRGPFGHAQLKTADNDNGVLYRFYMDLLADRHQLDDREWRAASFRTLLSQLQVGFFRGNERWGLYHRNPDRLNSLNSFENYVAIAAGSAIYGKQFVTEICAYGQAHGWVFANIPCPDGTSFLRRFFWGWRQPGDIAFYKLCAGFVPSGFETFWLAAGFVVQAFLPPKGDKHTSENLLCVVKNFILERPLVWRTNMSHVGVVLIDLARKFWLNRFLEATNEKGVEQVMEAFFTDPEHPIKDLAKGISH